MENGNITVECSVCNKHLVNHIGSTPCCGAIAYSIEDGKVTNDIFLFAKTNKRIHVSRLKINK